MSLTYAVASETGPLVPVVATYSCPDPFLKLEVTVANPEGVPVTLTTFRADMRQ